MRINVEKYLGAALCAVSFLAIGPGIGHAAGTWTPTNAPASMSTAWLLTDGRVMAQQYCTNHWWALSPDAFGNYTTGTWRQLADTPTTFAPLYYASAVLPNGKLIVMGGEYSAPNCTSGYSTLSYMYDPATNVWTQITPPVGWSGADANSIVLSDGRFVVADPFSTAIFALNASTLAWTRLPSTGKADQNDEEGWTLLPSGKFLTVDAWIRTSSEIYDPSAQSWSSAGSTLVNLSDAVSEEVGPAVLMYNGNVFATGGGMHFTSTTLQPGHTAAYNVSSGAWTAGPDFPTPLDVADGPAALLTNGNVLVVASPGTFQPGSHFYEYDGANLNAAPATLTAAARSSFEYRFLLLPNGQVMATVDSSTDVEFYTSTGTFLNSWQPAITSAPSAILPGATYAIAGTQFNGLSQAVSYGDDAQQSTNYPLVRITNTATGHVFYAKTHDHGSMGVATGGTVVTTNFDVPAAIEMGPSKIAVVANGIPSADSSLTVGIVTTTAVAPVSGQYSDPVTLSATIGPSGSTFSGSLQFVVNGVNAGAAIPVSGAGTYTTSYTIGLAAGPYTIQAVLTTSSPALGSSGTNTLTVTREDATITPSSGNPLAVQVNTAGGTAGPIVLRATLAQAADGSLGDINKAGVTVTLVPVVSGGGSINCPASNSSGAVTATCSTVPVNAYNVQWTITGSYFTGPTANSVLAVYDPSLGFVTGGGTVLDGAVPAEFAINVKYLKNGNIQGGMWYVEHRTSGDVVVRTNALTSLSIVGNTAVLLSKATIDGVGNYSIQATVTDNGEPGINVDLFGLQAPPVLSFAPAAISGGNIQVPH